MTSEELYTLYHHNILIVARSMRIPPCASAWISREDLEQEGYVAALRMLERFDASKGIRFWTYAEHRVAGAMRDAIARSFWNRAGRRDATTRDDLHEETAAWWRYEARTSYAHAYERKDEESEEHTRLMPQDPSGISHARKDQDAPLEWRDLRARVASVMGTLPQQWQDVYRAVVYEERSNTAVAAEIGVHPTRVSQIVRLIARALQRVLIPEAERTPILPFRFDLEGSGEKCLQKKRNLSVAKRQQQRDARRVARQGALAS